MNKKVTKMDDLYAFLNNLAIENGIKFIFIEKIDKFGKKQKLIPCVLALAESSLYIASKNVFNKCKITHMYSLLDLKLVGYIQISIANLDFGDQQLKFTSSNTKNLVTQIVSQAHRLLTEEEFSAISLPNEFPNLPDSTPQSFLWRLQLQLSQLKEPLDISSIGNIQTGVFYQNDSFKFNDLPMEEEIFPIFFNSLCLNSGFKHLVFNPITKFDIFEILSKYFNFSSKIEKLTFKHGPTQFFPNFIERFTQIQNSNLCSLSFVKAEISDVELIVLFSVVMKNKITSLTFAKSISNKQLLNITSHECFFNLRSLTLQGIQDLDIEAFAPFSLDIHSLSIIDCGETTIGGVINAITKYPSHNIHYLCVHSKSCGQIISKLPQKLLHVVADDIEWGSNEFARFMTLCASHPNRITVSVANTKIINNEIEKSITSFTQEATASNISALVWDGNMTNSNLIVFLKKCQLKYVSMCGCPSKIPIGDLCMLLDNNNSIETLKVEGTKENSLDDITPICDMLPLLPSLKEFDIAYQKISNAEMKYMGEKLSQCKMIEKIAFQGTNATSLSPFNECAATLVQNGRHVSIVWPYEDIMRLTNEGKMTPEEETELLTRYQYTARTDDSNNPFDKPFSVFCGRFSIEFPRVLTQKKLEGDNHTEAYKVIEETVTETQSHYGSVHPIQIASRRAKKENQSNLRSKSKQKNQMEVKNWNFNDDSGEDEENPVKSSNLHSMKQWNFDDPTEENEEEEEEEEQKPTIKSRKVTESPKEQETVNSRRSVRKNKKLGEMDWEFNSIANAAAKKQEIQPLPVKSEKSKSKNLENDEEKVSKRAKKQIPAEPEEKPKKKKKVVEENLEIQEEKTKKKGKKVKTEEIEEVKPTKKGRKSVQEDLEEEKPKKKKSKQIENEIEEKPKRKGRKAQNNEPDDEKPKEKRSKASKENQVEEKPKKKGKKHDTNDSDKEINTKRKGKKVVEEIPEKTKKLRKTKSQEETSSTDIEHQKEQSFVIDAGNRIEGTPVNFEFNPHPKVEQTPAINNSAFIRKNNVDYSLNSLIRSMTL